MKNLPSRYDRTNSPTSESEDLNNLDNIVAEIPAIDIEMDAMSPRRQDQTIGLFSLLQKYDEINETGLLRNVATRTKSVLPGMEPQTKPQKKDKRSKKSGLGKYVDQSVSNRSINRPLLKSAGNKINFG